MSALIKSPGFPSLRSMMEDFWNSEKLFDQSFFRNGDLPAVNVKETAKSYKIDVAVPGFKKEDFKVNIENGVLFISAEAEKEESEEKETYTRREFSRSSFMRSFGLPENVKEEKVSANYENGVLKLILEKGKVEKLKRKQIAVS